MVDQYPQEFSAIETRARASGAPGNGISDCCRDPRRRKGAGACSMWCDKPRPMHCKHCIRTAG
ncbi:hypothetical protein I546_7185 [Mycobacterium kansasii 732]|nr:hypothetical protein I546_7185 [Mycobacterium kansasii 732]